jgi:hypothetical protein
LYRRRTSGLGDTRGFRLLNVINDFSSDGLGIEAYYSLPAEQVIRSPAQTSQAITHPLSVIATGQQNSKVGFSLCQDTFVSK